jgi:hypothetical protein
MPGRSSSRPSASRSTRTVAEERPPRVPSGPLHRRSQPGWPEVILVAIGVVAVVLGAAALTDVLPTEIQRLIFHGPVLIAVLVGGTAWLLWRISRGRPA